MIFRVKHKDYEIPTSLDEVSFNRALELDKWVEENSSDEIKDLIRGVGEQVPAAELLKFQIEYVAQVSKADVSVLRGCRREDIDNLFKLTIGLSGFPDYMEEKEFIELDGVKLYPSPVAVDALGNESRFEHADWATWEEGNVVMDLVRQQDTAKNLFLPYLTAVIYRERIKVKKGWFRKKEVEEIEPYDYEKSVANAAKIGQLPASTIYGAYFFLLTLKQTQLKTSQDFLVKALQEKQARFKRLAPLLHLRFRIVNLGLGLRMKWQRLVSLINTDSLLERVSDVVRRGK